MPRSSLPPRWFVTGIWKGHRSLYRTSGGRLGLRLPTSETAGMLAVRTVGRTSGAERTAIVCYIADGENLVTLAMNGWGRDDPQWWRNLQQNPTARIDTLDGRREVRASAATDSERARLWAAVRGVRGWANDLDEMAALRNRETAVVVFAPA